MNKKFLIGAVLSAVLSMGHAQVQPTEAIGAVPKPAVGSEKVVSDPASLALVTKLKTMYPNTTFSGVRPSAIEGIYEVLMGQNVGYTDGGGRYFLFGHLFDMKEQVDLTAQVLGQDSTAKREVKTSVEYPSAYLTNAIKTVKGDGSRQLVVFSDPNCPYCKKLEQELVKLNNVTIYTFLYPVLGPDSRSLSIAMWCAPNRAQAFGEFMLKGKRPAMKSCTTPLDENATLGGRLGVTGTPTLIAADGRFLPGAAPAEKINQWLNEGVKP